jgi:aspartyl protease family protein
LAADSVLVKGLFNNAALLIVDGKRMMIKKGQTKRGITLIEANTKGALVEMNGERHRMSLSQQVGGSYQTARKRVVRIAAKEGGHHWIRGKINGRSVDFVVDTGASLVSLNYSTAKRLGVDIDKGDRAHSSTANGVKEVRIVTLPAITIGEITHHNVKASVGLDDALPIALLGNSFLSRTNMRIENGVLVLESK